MPFVKLDAGILTSTLWEEPDATKLVFLTALLLAGPHEVTEPMEQLEIRSLKTTSFVIPPGWYGFVAAAGIGIIRQARVEPEPGLTALEKLGGPDPASRSSVFEGRRLVRVEGGFVVLNFFKYRDRDYSAAERMRKLRARKAEGKSASDVQVCSPNECNVRPNVTHSRGQSTEAEAEKIKTSPSELETSSDQVTDFSESGSKEKPSPKAPSHEAEKLTALLVGEIRKNAPDFRITPGQQRKWALIADLMLRRDRRSYDEIASVIQWCQADEFWRSNVLSMQKVRERFDQLAIKRGQAGGKARAQTVPSPDYTRGLEGFVVRGKQ
jgi:hypothetical protein